MRAARIAIAFAALVFVSGCFPVPPTPPETIKDFAYVAPLTSAEESDFFRFDLPLSSPVWQGIKMGYGRPSVLDRDSKIMRCGRFGIDADSLARPTVTTLPLTRLGKPEFPCDRNAPNYGRCVQTHPQGTALYEVQFAATPDAGKQPYPYLRFHWNHPPTQGGTLYELDDEGRITAQMLIGTRLGNKTVTDTQEERLAVRINKPALRLLIDTRENDLDLQSVEFIEREKRGDESSYWFEAAGAAPYQLVFDWKHAHCYSRLNSSESPPPRIGDPNWPAIATIGASRPTDRTFLDKFHGDLDYGWWVVLEIAFPLWIAGLVLGLLYRFTGRRGS
jgi:hypothetical protein